MKAWLIGLICYLSSIGGLAYLAWAAVPNYPTYWGISAFAAMHPKYPCNRLLKILKVKEVNAVAILWGTFGKSTKCIKKIYELWGSQPEKEFLLEVHFSNESCRRFGRCKAGELYRGLGVNAYNKRLTEMNDATAAAVFFRVQAIVQALLIQAPIPPNVDVWLSSGLEDNFTPLAAKKLIATLKESWPGNVVRNGVKKVTGDKLAGADIREYHGLWPESPQPCIYSNDGMPMPVSGLSHSAKLHNQCTRFLWFPKGQGISGTKFIEPRKRSFVIPKSDIIAVKKVTKEIL